MDTPVPVSFSPLSLANSSLSELFVTRHPTFTSAVFGIGYDQDGDGGGFTPGIPQDAPGGGVGSENGFANDPDDSYAEGWFTGFWSFQKGTVSGNTITFSSMIDNDNYHSQLNPLSDQDWVAFNFSPGFVSQSLTVPYPVPEPATGLLMLLGFAFVSLIRRKANAAA